MSRFNGAVGFRLRRPGAGRDVDRVLPELQWGRRFSPTETRLATHSPASICLLQWGRRFSPTETPRPARGDMTGPLLQWGRRFSPTETVRTPRGKGILYSGFNGAVGFRLRRPPDGSGRPSRRRPRFNGAVGFRLRRRLPGKGLRYVAIASMGP